MTPGGYMARHGGKFPRRTDASRPGWCTRCRAPIAVGEEITYSPQLHKWIHGRCAR